MPLNLFITGTDTGVGKTVLSVLLTRALLARGVDASAVKPFCSGGRADARALWAAQNRGRGDAESAASLDAVNPWHFREALAPLVAARRAGQSVELGRALAFLRTSGRGRQTLIIEGAGGLLSPLGEGFDARDLIEHLRAVPIIVASNRLGALNHVLLTWDALPNAVRRRAQLVLMEPARADRVSRTNGELLEERLGGDRICCLPMLTDRFLAGLASAQIPVAVSRPLDRLVSALTDC
jgi:dethiobiotin synthetase